MHSDRWNMVILECRLLTGEDRYLRLSRCEVDREGLLNRRVRDTLLVWSNTLAVSWSGHDARPGEREARIEDKLRCISCLWLWRCLSSRLGLSMLGIRRRSPDWSQWLHQAVAQFMG